MKKKLLYNREEMTRYNIEKLNERGVKVEEIAQIAFNQQSRYTKNITFDLCIESVLKILSFRDVFHHIQLGAEIDRLAEEGKFNGPIQEILYNDLGLFGIDEVVGLDISGLYGSIGQTNFGDIDVNKPGIIKELDIKGKSEASCNTFLDDIVGAIAAAASTRVAQVVNEDLSNIDQNVKLISLFDKEGEL